VEVVAAPPGRVQRHERPRRMGHHDEAIVGHGTQYAAADPAGRVGLRPRARSRASDQVNWVHWVTVSGIEKVDGADSDWWEEPIEIDRKLPHMARMYDYLLGGRVN